ncbi:MAG: hypothetical protein QXI49_07650 [Candidatus Methanomethylicaceae archaeon]
MTDGQVSTAGAAGTAGVVGATLSTYIALRLADYAAKLVSMAVLRVIITKVVDTFTKPEEVLDRITPAELRDKLKWREGGAGRLKYAIDFVKFLRDFNMKFADLTTFASIFGIDAAQVANAVSNAYQWSYGLGWLSWIGTGQILSKTVSEAIGQELDYMIRAKLLTESAALDAWKKGLISDNECKEYLFRLGYDEEKAELIMKKEAIEMVSGITSFLTQIGAISKDEFIRRMKLFGLDEKQAEIAYLSSFKLPETTLLIKAFKSGLISEDIVRRYLKAKGYDDLTISLILVSAKEERTEDDKKLAKNEVLTFFRYGLIDELEARNLLQSLGYDLNEIELFINFEKMRLTLGKKEVDKKLSKAEVLRAYRDKVISRIEAEELLSRLGYDSNEINILLQLAEQTKIKEKAERKKDIARSDILRAFRLGIITRELAKNMMTQLGFSEDEAEFILKSAEVREEEKRTLTATQIITAASRRIIRISEAYDYLKSLGYGDFEVIVLFRLNYADREVLALIEALKTKRIREDEFVNALNAIGFSAADITILKNIFGI